MVEAGIEHTFFRVESGTLLQHTHADVATEDDVARVVALFARQNREQCRLARAVLGYQTHMLSFGDRETDVFKQQQRAERLRQLLNV